MLFRCCRFHDYYYYYYYYYYCCCCYYYYYYYYYYIFGNKIYVASETDRHT